MGRFSHILMFVPGVFLTVWGLSRLAEGNDATEQLVAGMAWLGVAFFVGRATRGGMERFRQLAEQQERHKALLTRGIRASARVLQVQQTGLVLNNVNPEVRLTLQVEHPQLGSYEAETKTFVQMVALPRVQPGQALEVRVDPDDPQQLAVVL